MKNRSRLVEYAVPLAALAVLGMYVWTGFVGLMVTGLITGVLATLPIWSRRCARKRAAYIDSIVKLAFSAYPPADRSHAERVAELAGRIAQEMGLPRRKVALIRVAGYLHDIGRYIKDEYTSDCRHTAKGADLVTRLPVLCQTAEWIRHHHTWHNGISCLASLAHQKVPVEAAILAVAEHFDTITHDGTEQAGLDEAIEDVRRRVGTQFHSAVVKALLVTSLQTPVTHSCQAP
jgi:putative nucleotidyltransferase with HDIG domain